MPRNPLPEAIETRTGKRPTVEGRVRGTANRLLHPFAFESRHEPVAPRWKFSTRLLRNGIWGAGVIGISLIAGMVGYRGCEGMDALDAFVNAAMILSGMGPVGELHTTCGKIFAGSYALYSGLLLIGVAGLVFAPIFHRVLHQFHVDEHGTD